VKTVVSRALLGQPASTEHAPAASAACTCECLAVSVSIARTFKFTAAPDFESPSARLNSVGERDHREIRPSLSWPTGAAGLSWSGQSAVR